MLYCELILPEIDRVVTFFRRLHGWGDYTMSSQEHESWFWLVGAVTDVPREDGGTNMAM